MGLDSRLLAPAWPPDDRRTEPPAVVLALDSSGSISTEQLDQLVAIAAARAPRRARVWTCTFARDFRALRAGSAFKAAEGATDFSAVERFVARHVRRDLRGRYPDLVMTITDGHGSFLAERPTDTDLDRWLWLLAPGGVTASRLRRRIRAAGARVEPLSDYLERA